MGIHDVDNSGVDLTSTGTVAQVNLGGDGRVTVILENAGGSPTVELQVRKKDGTWRTFHSYGSVSSIQDSRALAAGQVRVQITSGATSGTGDFYVAAGD